jgi:hypothetical protein
MSKLTELASGRLTRTETIIVILSEPDGMPASVIVHWPSKPTALDPKAFSPAADVAVKTLAAAVVRLAQVRRDRRLS